MPCSSRIARQMFVLPEVQCRHSRHCGENSVRTWSPGLQRRHALADRLDDAGALVPEDGRRVARRVDAAGGVHVGVADPAGRHAHEHLARLRPVEPDRLDDERLAEFLEDCCADLHAAGRYRSSPRPREPRARPYARRRAAPCDRDPRPARRAREAARAARDRPRHPGRTDHRPDRPERRRQVDADPRDRRSPGRGRRLGHGARRARRRPRPAPAGRVRDAVRVRLPGSHRRGERDLQRADPRSHERGRRARDRDGRPHGHDGSARREPLGRPAAPGLARLRAARAPRS